MQCFQTACQILAKKARLYTQRLLTFAFDATGAASMVSFGPPCPKFALPVFRCAFTSTVAWKKSAWKNPSIAESNATEGQKHLLRDFILSENLVLSVDRDVESLDFGALQNRWDKPNKSREFFGLIHKEERMRSRTRASLEYFRRARNCTNEGNSYTIRCSHHDDAYRERRNWDN